MEVTILNASGDGVGPSLLLSHGGGAGQYLVNVPEGFSRLVLEHRIRPCAKLSCLVLTSIRPVAAGGIGGLILRLAQDGHEKLEVTGPRGSAAFVHALRHIFRWRHPKVFVSEWTEGNVPVFEDEYVVIFPILASGNRCQSCVYQQNASFSRHHEEDLLPELDEDSNPVFVRDTRGNHSIADCTAPGSSPVTTVLGYTFYLKKLNSSLLILDIPDCSTLSGMEADAILHCEQHPQGIAAVIHLSPGPVVTSEEYSRWIENYQSFHVLVNASSPQYGFQASLRTTAMLNMVSKKFFPIPANCNECEPSAAKRSSLTSGHLLSRIVLERGSCGDIVVRMDHSKCIENFNFTNYQEDLLKLQPWLRDKLLNMESQRCSSNQLVARAMKRSMLRKSCGQSRTAVCSSDDFEVQFFGTGSAEPSKYRGSSGVLLRLRGSAAMLLDAGEGVLGQIFRSYGEAKALEAVNSIECLWLSHKHADHVLGAVAIVCSQARERTKPLLVIGSTAVVKWLTEVCNAHAQSGFPLPAFVVMHFEEFEGSHHLGRVLETLQLKSIASVPVNHCYEAYGLVLHGQTGWHLVYSGDTRPSDRLIQAGAGCTLLIHEATFEDCLESHARKKRHCTVSEALQVGSRMQAEQVILTHFSQRYPKVVEIDVTSYPNACVAFDGMVVTSSSMRGLRELQGVVRMVLAAQDPWIAKAPPSPEGWQSDTRKRHLEGSLDAPKPPSVPKHIRWESD
ncbi:hypothetical protein SELMODRAFT_416540 [Selaginella moellendorffii]|uniref:ribonuclease Z n=1 Tax=Selaginella moellendorffii TaxID=88036 RepID=D8RZL7_SELML|nr:tRNase Z TRZ3, mitochondrial isoform X1 [Selaginella moellendorffii]EFJ22319.1 hypothetical protein SELMODRAFT_416540 [Selaginella moellendorffii]|eukprot:XP_002976650.1 tRNase Z TRZ3, mitochondrial isoform X1 [Selaginella moellendorffii]